MFCFYPNVNAETIAPIAFWTVRGRNNIGMTTNAIIIICDMKNIFKNLEYELLEVSIINRPTDKKIRDKKVYKINTVGITIAV